jgi:hypothetical protein
MFLAHNQPFLNFDHLVDINGLLAIKPYVSAFIAKNHHLLKPTKFHGSLFKDGNNGTLGIHDYQDEFRNNPNTIADPNLREVMLDLLRCDQFANYIVFEQDVTSCTFHVVPRYALDYATKHHATECVALPEDKQFAFFYEWLDRQEIFSDYGRVTLWVNYPGAYSAVHTDYADDSRPAPDEFIWIDFAPDRKKFYLVDDADEKIYSPGYCNWFNTNNRHGSDPAPQACYSLRVDGVFSDAFKRRAFT